MSGTEEKQERKADEPKESSIVDDSNSESSMAIYSEYEQDMFDDSSSVSDVYEYNMIDTDNVPTHPYILYASTSRLLAVNSDERPELTLEYVPSHRIDVENPPEFYVKLQKRSQVMLQRMIQRNIAYLDDHCSSSDSDASDSEEIPNFKHIANRPSTK